MAKLQRDRCDLVKIDTEGYDLSALRQLAPAIVRDRPVLIVEYERESWARFGGDLTQARELFRGWDYELFHLRCGLVAPLPDAVDDCDLIGIPVTTPDRRSCAAVT